MSRHARAATYLSARPDAIVFDLDGTLVDSAPAIAAALELLRAKRGFADPLDVSQVRSWVSRGASELINFALGEKGPAGAAAVDEFRVAYARIRTTGDSLYDGIVHTLERLATMGIRLAVCSNKPQRLSEKVLEDVGIRRFFQAIVGGDAVTNPKPHPDHLLTAIDAVRSHPSRALYVGDSLIDFLAARAAKVEFLLAGYGYFDRPSWAAVRDEEPFRIDSPPDILHALKAWFPPVAGRNTRDYQPS
jgi:phosphoglycolate phosphatase